MCTDDAQYYRILLHGHIGEDGCYQAFWVTADHLGVAIDRAAQIAREQEIERPVVCEAIPEEHAPDDAIEAGEGVLCQPEIHLYAFDPTQEPLQFPLGIVPSWNPDELDTDKIVEGYAVDAEHDPFDVELVVDRRRVRHVLYDLVRKLPAAHALEIRVCGHWDFTYRTGIWVGPAWDSHETLCQYIEDRQDDLLLNGLVELGMLCSDAHSVLRLDDHKTIRFSTTDLARLDDCVARIRDLGFGARDPLFTLARGFYHQHYRPASALDRAELIESLEADGFRYVDTLEDEEYNSDPE